MRAADIYNVYEFCRNAREHKVPVMQTFNSEFTFKLEYKQGRNINWFELAYFSTQGKVEIGKLYSPKSVYDSISLIVKEDR